MVGHFVDTAQPVAMTWSRASRVLGQRTVIRSFHFSHPQLSSGEANPNCQRALRGSVQAGRFLADWGNPPPRPLFFSPPVHPRLPPTPALVARCSGRPRPWPRGGVRSMQISVLLADQGMTSTALYGGVLVKKGSHPKFENLSLAYLITYHHYVSFRPTITC
jgi:hypothetical protein